jgi:hypothetical protein
MVPVKFKTYNFIINQGDNKKLPFCGHLVSFRHFGRFTKRNLATLVNERLKKSTVF